jgi:hypothetical protein
MVAINLDRAARATVSAIESARLAGHNAFRSRRLGASSWGGECERKSWYAFRYTLPPETFSGQMLRLFDTGHREEARIVEDLKRAGFEVIEFDPETFDPKRWKQRQWEYTYLDGHGVCKLDGKIAGIPEAPKAWHVLEIKTHNKKSFDKLEPNGVQKAKPEHYAQMQLGMLGAGLDRALYVALCKDNDAYYCERVEADSAFQMDLLAKGSRIVFSDEAPKRLHPDPTKRDAFACGWCQYKDNCHGVAWAERNCRTCLHSTPSKKGGGVWTCARFDGEEIPADFQSKSNACALHLFNPAFVPGDLLSVDQSAWTVTYRLIETGETWTDGLGLNTEGR